jgi:hypothetical protein
MKSIELKQNLHNLIDSIDNINLLQSFYDLIKTKSTAKDGQLWNRLSQAEQKELLLAFSESDDIENLVDHEQIKSRYKKWL